MNDTFDYINKFVSVTEDQSIRIQNYIDFLIQYNQELNLIGKSTENDILNRHIVDCLQVINYIDNKDIKLADLGTGAGLPGILLSILGIKEVYLFEKSPCKCEFLEKAKTFSQNKIVIVNKNIQDVKNEKFDVITSRALGSLNLLLELSLNLKKENTQLIFLKGKKVFEEIKEAEKKWKINYKLFESITSTEGRIVKIFDYSIK